jgi:hypothetical protein
MCNGVTTSDLICALGVRSIYLPHPRHILKESDQNWESHQNGNVGISMSRLASVRAARVAAYQSLYK